MSDIVFLRAWYGVKPRRFYNPVTNLLFTSEEEQAWTGMRLTGEVRAYQSIPTPKQANSAYRPVERQDRHFNPLRVPRLLAADLPFKSQIVQMKAQKKQTYMQKRAVVLGGEEKKARELMTMLTTLRKREGQKEEGGAGEAQGAIQEDAKGQRGEESGSGEEGERRVLAEGGQEAKISERRRRW